MNNIKQLEDILLLEINAREENTFMYQLHECDIFIVKKLDYFIDTCEKLITQYKLNGKTNNYTNIVKGIITVFEHTLFLLHVHFVPEDFFKIKNYDELSPDIISDFYSKIRQVSDDMIF